jgi:hypothetical protein
MQLERAGDPWTYTLDDKMDCQSAFESLQALPDRAALSTNVLTQGGSGNLDLVDAERTRRSRTKKDWEVIKERFRQLYLDENLKLKDVMKILSTQDAFIASEKMFKSKITQWGFEKNYKAEDKKQMAMIIKSYKDNSQEVPALIIKGRRAKLDRVRRFCKQRKFLEDICKDIPSTSSSLPSGKARGKNSPGFAQSRQVMTWITSHTMRNDVIEQALALGRPLALTATTTIDRIEDVLRQTQVYLDSCYSKTSSAARHHDRLLLAQSSKHALYIDALSYFWGKLYSGMSLLENSIHLRAWESIDEGCDQFAQLLPEQHVDLITSLILEFSLNCWVQFPELKARLLSFFYEMSATIVGGRHPVSIILNYMRTDKEIIINSLEDVMKLSIEVAQQNLNADDDNLWKQHGNMLDLLSVKEDWIAAERCVLKYVAEAEEKLGTYHFRTVRLRRELGEIYYNQGHNDTAKLVYQDLLQRIGEIPDCTARFIRTSVRTHESLAVIAEQEDDFPHADVYWRTALEGNIELFGPGHDDIVLLLHNIEKHFQKRGKDLRDWLRENFLNLDCETVNGWTLPYQT